MERLQSTPHFAPGSSPSDRNARALQTGMSRFGNLNGQKMIRSSPLLRPLPEVCAASTRPGRLDSSVQSAAADSKALRGLGHIALHLRQRL